MFNDALQPVLYELKDAIAKESFEQKGKFPPSLKPMLTKVALQAIHCGEYNDNFFSLMPKLFIYNKFTMTVSFIKFSLVFFSSSTEINCFRNSLSARCTPSTKSCFFSGKNIS